MKVKVEITLDVPDNMKGVGPWTLEQTVFSYVKHWLEDGYYCGDYTVELPSGIGYNGFELEWEK